MVKGIIRNVFDLGFYRDDPQIYLGGGLSWKQIAWDVISWLLLSLGIFLRQGLDLTPLSWTLERLNWGAFLASVVIALAVFRFFMKRFNRSRPVPGFEHVAAPFAFGFFLDLATLSALKLSAKLFAT